MLLWPCNWIMITKTGNKVQKLNGNIINVGKIWEKAKIKNDPAVQNCINCVPSNSILILCMQQNALFELDHVTQICYHCHTPMILKLVWGSLEVIIMQGLKTLAYAGFYHGWLNRWAIFITTDSWSFMRVKNCLKAENLQWPQPAGNPQRLFLFVCFIS